MRGEEGGRSKTRRGKEGKEVRGGRESGRGKDTEGRYSFFDYA